MTNHVQKETLGCSQVYLTNMPVFLFFFFQAIENYIFKMFCPFEIKLMCLSLLKFKTQFPNVNWHCSVEEIVQYKWKCSKTFIIGLVLLMYRAHSHSVYCVCTYTACSCFIVDIFMKLINTLFNKHLISIVIPSIEVLLNIWLRPSLPVSTFIGKCSSIVHYANLETKMYCSRSK